MFHNETPNFPKLKNDKAVLFSEENCGTMVLGRATLNRPQVLNALNTECYEQLEPRLLEWARDPRVAAVLLDSVGEKAFSAGGDVKSLVQETREKGLDIAKTFFTREYFTDFLLQTYPKPVIALADGITMGGGMGLVNGASHRVVTERTVMAMPEVAIGLFPDVGATRFLSDVKIGFGIYLGLTGARITGADALACGLADHFVPAASLRKMNADLLRLPWSPKPKANFKLLDEYFARVSPEGPPPQHFLDFKNEAAPLFKEKKYLKLAAAFAQAPFESSLLQEGQRRFLQGSPLAERVFFEALRHHRRWDMRKTLTAEWDMAIRFSKESDFAEGVRAVLIDKDGKPRWRDQRDSEVADWKNYFSSGEKNLLAEKLKKFRW